MKNVNNNPCISIVIPVHNSERFLRGCLDSVIGQTYDNLEIIIVENGSTDDSWKICEEYKKMDDRIIAVQSGKPNVSHARNLGLKRVSGDYVMFVDSDDTVHVDAVKILVDISNKKKCDVVKYNYEYEKDSKFYKGKMWELAGQAFREKDVMGPVEYFFSTEKNVPCYPWALFIKRKEAVLFNEGLQKYEDTEYMVRLLANIKSIYFLDKALYRYSYNYSSATKSPREALSNISEMITSYSMVKEFLADRGLLNDEISCKMKICALYLTIDKLRIYAAHGISNTAKVLKNIFRDQIYDKIPLASLTPKIRILYMLVMKKRFYAVALLIFLFRIRKAKQND